MQARSQRGHAVPSWKELREQAVAAVEADIAAIHQRGDYRRLTTKGPVSLPDGNEPLVIPIPSALAGPYWKEQLFFVAEGPRPAAEDRRLVLYRSYSSSRLQLRIPDETRAALRGVQSVHVFYVDDFELRLRRALLDLLQDAPDGKAAAQLWDAGGSAIRDPLPPSPVSLELHASQQHALDAITSPGGWLLWGPPGTGKTTVITEAVRSALANGLSVLIASHAHVAVDNVIEGVADPNTGVEFECGDIIRVASPLTEPRVSARVRGHDHLLLGKAAAVLNRTDERRAALQARIDANETHDVRAKKDALDRMLVGVDVAKIERAKAALAAQSKVADLTTRLEEIDAERTAMRQQMANHTAKAERLDVPDAERAEAEDARRHSEEALDEAERGLAAAAAAQARAEAERDASASRLALAQGHADTISARLLPPVRAIRRRRMEALTSDHATALRAVADATSLHEQASRHAERCRMVAASTHAALVRLAERARQAVAERAAAGRLAVAEEGLAGRAGDLDDEIWESEEVAALMPAPEARSVLDEAEGRGWLDALERIAAVGPMVERLDNELQKLREEKKNLEAQEDATRERLLREARLVACTLATYILMPSLRERHFDIVILDEAASISAPEIILAGSRADRTFAAVGDFLQNAPIAETDSGDSAAHPWQGTDVFTLVGIRDRETAERHARCTALSCQHRFPRIIADVVNAFCYEGLLETAASVKSESGTVITVLDTSAHPDKVLLAAGRSWWGPLGLDLLRTIAERPDLRVGSSIGFITPYRGQADRARNLMLRNEDGTLIECGTAHAFQGRQYDTVVVDLMQDHRPRWVSKADLHGTDHAVAAAKLLNVALTRARRRLYLIGDWDFIRGCSSPGMRALAALAAQTGVSVVAAGSLTKHESR
jgi:AAA domain-containing protein